MGLREQQEDRSRPHPELRVAMSKSVAAIWTVRRPGWVVFVSGARTVTSPAAERKATQIADDFLSAEFDDDDETKAWLVKHIKAALEEAEEAGYKKAMCKRF
jgi:hypothetical protein